MAKVIKINKSRKEQVCSKCKSIIEIGSPYLKASPYKRKPVIRCTSCGLRSYEVSGSEYIRRINEIQNEWSNLHNICESLADDIISDLEELRDTQQDSLDNMPDQLQEAYVGEMLQERIEYLDYAINNLEEFDYESIEEEAHDEAVEEYGEYKENSDEYSSKEEYDNLIEEKLYFRKSFEAIVKSKILSQ